MILVDTSVWVAHFKNSNSKLVSLLHNDMVLCHPFIIAEIACGTPPNPREQTLGDLKLLRCATVATHNEVLSFIESNTLYGRGCGFIDLALLAATKLTEGASLWTFDKRLHEVCSELGFAYIDDAINP